MVNKSKKKKKQNGFNRSIASCAVIVNVTRQLKLLMSLAHVFVHQLYL